jgi:hypothetical protein
MSAVIAVPELMALFRPLVVTKRQKFRRVMGENGSGEIHPSRLTAAARQDVELYEVCSK